MNPQCPACLEDRLHTSDELRDFHGMFKFAPQWRPDDSPKADKVMQ
jgi:hypothetical protein